MAATVANQKTTRLTPTPDDETGWSRRKSVPVTYHTGDVTEQEDIVLAERPGAHVGAVGAQQAERPRQDVAVGRVLGGWRVAAEQVAHRFAGFAGDMDRNQVSRAQEVGQTNRILAVGLDPITRGLWHVRGKAAARSAA